MSVILAWYISTTAWIHFDTKYQQDGLTYYKHFSMRICHVSKNSISIHRSCGCQLALFGLCIGMSPIIIPLCVHCITVCGLQTVQRIYIHSVPVLVQVYTVYILRKEESNGWQYQKARILTTWRLGWNPTGGRPGIQDSWPRTFESSYRFFFFYSILMLIFGFITLCSGRISHFKK
jgi:hypothetical protein